MNKLQIEKITDEKLDPMTGEIKPMFSLTKLIGFNINETVMLKRDGHSLVKELTAANPVAIELKQAGKCTMLPGVVFGNFITAEEYKKEHGAYPKTSKGVEITTGTIRRAEACKSLSAVYFDVDNKGKNYISKEEMHKYLKTKYINYIIIDSLTSSPEKEKYHIIFPFDTPLELNSTHRKKATELGNAIFAYMRSEIFSDFPNKEAIFADKETFDTSVKDTLSRLMFISTPNHSVEGVWSESGAWSFFESYNLLLEAYEYMHEMQMLEASAPVEIELDAENNVIDMHSSNAAEKKEQKKNGHKGFTIIKDKGHKHDMVLRALSSYASRGLTWDDVAILFSNWYKKQMAEGNTDGMGSLQDEINKAKASWKGAKNKYSSDNFEDKIAAHSEKEANKQSKRILRKKTDELLASNSYDFMNKLLGGFTFFYKSSNRKSHLIIRDEAEMKLDSVFEGHKTEDKSTFISNFAGMVYKKLPGIMLKDAEKLLGVVYDYTKVARSDFDPTKPWGFENLGNGRHAFNECVLPKIPEVTCDSYEKIPRIAVIMDNLFGKQGTEGRIWAEMWLKNMLVLHKKNRNAIVIRSDEGAGKGHLAGTIIPAILGRIYCTTVDEETMTGSDSRYKLNKLFVNYNEVDANKYGEKGVANELKRTVTDDTIMLKILNYDRIEVKNFINVFISTNDEQPVKIGKKDRRYSFYAPKRVLSEIPEWTELGISKNLSKDLKEEAVLWYNYLKNHVEVDDQVLYSPYESEEKKMLASMSVSSIEDFVESLYNKDMDFFEDAFETYLVNMEAKIKRQHMGFDSTCFDNEHQVKDEILSTMICLDEAFTAGKISYKSMKRIWNMVNFNNLKGDIAKKFKKHNQTSKDDECKVKKDRGIHLNGSVKYVSTFNLEEEETENIIERTSRDI